MKKLNKILFIVFCGLLLPLTPQPQAYANDMALLGGGVGGIALLGVTPTHQMEQIYYLGVFDPQEQVDPMFYRVVVKGQASSISLMKFASGWVPAEVVDSLNEGIGFEQNNGNLSLKSIPGSTNETTDLQNKAKLEIGRRMVVFGPEGFRVVPKNNRLVIVMGSSPDKFFEGIDEILGEVSKARTEKEDTELRKKLFEALYLVKTERDGLDEVESDLNSFLSNQ